MGDSKIVNCIIHQGLFRFGTILILAQLVLQMSISTNSNNNSNDNNNNNNNNEKILLTTMVTIKILFTINSLKKRKKLFI